MMVILLILCLHLWSISSQPLPSDCQNYYSPENLPPECIDSDCTFGLGLFALVKNQSQSKAYQLCLNLPTYHIDLVYTGSKKLAEQIRSVYLLGMGIKIEGYYSLVCTDVLQLMADNITVEGVTLSAKKIWMWANDMAEISQTQISYDIALDTTCDCENKKSQCVLWKFKYPHLFQNSTLNMSILSDYQINNVVDNSLTIISFSQTTIQESTLKYSIIGLFSQTHQINTSTITTSGLGFKSDSGQGCGYFDEVLNQLLGCMGSGGSHGGFGGNSYPENCYLLVSNPPYGSIQFPYAPGSGGGFFLRHIKESSSGGGVLNIQSKVLSFIKSVISADGKNAVQGGGGGAGGGISIDYNYVISDYNSTVSESQITAVGGNGQKSSSGAGGRIRLWNHNWVNESQYEQKNSLSIKVDGGTNCPGKLSCGEQGSVYTSPCRPGYYLNKPNYLCTKCPVGTYQVYFSYSTCLPCDLKPDNAQYTGTDVEYDYQSACNYTCDEGYEMRNNLCLSQFEDIIDNFGGINILISFGIIVGSIIVYLFVALVRKLSETENILVFDQKANDSYSQTKYFRIEDLPYHEHRIYLSGENAPFSPWVLDEKSIANFKAQMKNPVTKINQFLQRIFQQISNNCKYSKFETILIFILTYTYYAFSRVMLNYFRAKKVKAIFKEVVLVNKKIPDFESVGVKFHVKEQLTVGSLEIFNYTKSVFDFYIQNYFPLYLMLEKCPFKGYAIDFSDPFLRVFMNEASETDEENHKTIEKFLKQTNRLLKNTDEILPLLNHLWSINQILPRVRIYLWQPPNRVLGIDKEYAIDKSKELYLLISSGDYNNKHFISKEELPALHLHEIQYLKHKFNIRKESLNVEPKNSFWIINNTFTERSLLWGLGISTVLNLLLCLISFFSVVILTLEQNQSSFFYAIVMFYVIEPFCQFGAAMSSFRTIFSKNEHMLANTIFFTLTTIIKFLLLEISLLIYTLSSEDESQLFQVTLYLWLFILITGVCMLIVELMLRIRIISSS